MTVTVQNPLLLGTFRRALWVLNSYRCQKYKSRPHLMAVREETAYFHKGQNRMSKMTEKGCDRRSFDEEIRLLEEDPAIAQMEQYSQHHGNNTLQHVENVADVSFRIADRLHLDIDEKALARGAMLHDFYLYTTKDMEISKYRHGVGHPETALRNAKAHMELSEKEENIIRSHMWPLTITHLPKSKEAALVCVADKYCALREAVSKNKSLVKRRRG